MGKLYLIRHGKPDFPDDQKWCLGKTDLPLGKEGHLQSCLLGNGLGERKFIRVYGSSLVRSVETARYLCGQEGESNQTVQTDAKREKEAAVSRKLRIWPGLEEQDMGDWDGLSFAEIKIRWPQLYEERGTHPDLMPPKAETLEAAQKRFRNAVIELLEKEESNFSGQDHQKRTSLGDIAIVAHKTVIQLFLCDICGMEIQERGQFVLPYASITTIEYQNQKFSIEKVGEILRPPLTENLCEQLLESVKLPENIWRHCQAVALEGKRIVKELNQAGCKLDENMVVCGALLHDIARTSPKHSQVGAGWFRALGYDEIAEVILEHNYLSQESRLSEKAVVCLADKCILEDQKVLMEERFRKSFEKCKDADAQLAHRKRYELAYSMRDEINGICGKNIIL